MSTLLAVLLLVNAVWNVVVWPPFLRRVARDPRARDQRGRATAFLRVHVILVSVSLLIALVSAIAAIASFVA
ncbi:SCO4848 family membrane protein [Naasia lichenicola]|uniref:Integral membrane protein n=1 Tax=Naasia lichenicola TaxID=2565933 RepID=A0A4S4FHU4_9MICO|nr:hypothetical protein [Naasia lichenicola]THG28626.1 hypothetical protein E6C64_17670 [Naasia lichenicola]